MDREPLPDYTATIRAQIEREVAGLARDLPHKPQYVEVGYLLNAHHGKALFESGDTVAGVPVRIDRSLPRTIRVCADNIRHAETTEAIEEGETYGRRERVWYEDHFAQATW